MHVEALSENDAFKAGSDLWVIENNPQLEWWHKLDFATHSLLTENLKTSKKPIPEPLAKIIQATHLQTQHISVHHQNCLLGTSDHFLNKAVYLWSQQSISQVVDDLLKTMTSLHLQSLRLFSSSEEIIQQLKTRPTARSLTISFIEKT